jgi:hypothetical protein
MNIGKYDSLSIFIEDQIKALIPREHPAIARKVVRLRQSIFYSNSNHY